MTLYYDHCLRCGCVQVFHRRRCLTCDTLAGSIKEEIHVKSRRCHKRYSLLKTGCELETEGRPGRSSLTTINKGKDWGKNDRHKGVPNLGR